jgi:hypothetical protein
MKISELLKAVDAGWVRKPEGFRVRFQTRIEGTWVTDTMPGEAESLLDSDVVAWRSAWKLWQAAKSGVGEYVNITVVDDRGEPVSYYATGRFEVFNRNEEVSGAPLVEARAGVSSESNEATVEAQPGSGDEESEGQAAGDFTGR